MSRAENRAVRSQLRSAEYWRRRKIQMIIFGAAIFLYLGVPLLWYGAVEFDLVRPIRTPELEQSFNAVGLVLLFLIARGLIQWVQYRNDDDKAEKAEARRADAPTSA